MLCHDTMITISPRGQQKAVQDLSIADLIYNPITEGFDEISDILAREVPVSAISLAPILIRRGDIFAGRPYRDVAVSPAQKVLVSKKCIETKGLTVVVESEAKLLSSLSISPLSATKYFAIFFDCPRFIHAEGLLLRAYSLDDLSCSTVGYI